MQIQLNEAIGDGRAMEPIESNDLSSSILHTKLVVAMASCRLHQRVHDPDNILAEAAVNELMKSLTAAGVVITDLAVAFADATMPDASMQVEHPAARSSTPPQTS